MSKEDRFYSFQFFCPADKEKEALRILNKRKDVNLWPFSVQTQRRIFNSNGSEKVLEGVTLSGVCFRSRLIKILDRLSQRRIAAFNDESVIQLGPLPRIERIGVTEFGRVVDDLELRRN